MSASNGEPIVSGQQRDLMIQAATIAVIVVMIFNCGVAIEEPNQPSADYIMPGCRDAASLITFSNIGESEEEVARLNFCKGIVVGLSFMGQPYGICVPLARLLSKRLLLWFGISTDSPGGFTRTSTLWPLRLCEQIGRVH